MHLRQRRLIIGTGGVGVLQISIDGQGIQRLVWSFFGEDEFLPRGQAYDPGQTKFLLGQVIAGDNQLLIPGLDRKSVV